jgi:hypothetical protein
MPGAACGVWPSFWSLGSGEWPGNGEIDIIEGINKNTNNRISLHTADGCTVNGIGQTGILKAKICDVSFSTVGCTTSVASSVGYGSSFNAIGGGVYAMEWTSQAIKVWFFPRNAIPSSIKSGAPNVSQFGTPAGNFHGSCNIDKHFKSHSFTFGINFCGDWAGNEYQTSGCPMYRGLDKIYSCVQYVGQNPSAFKDAYWLINSLKVYKIAT